MRHSSTSPRQRRCHASAICDLPPPPPPHTVPQPPLPLSPQNGNFGLDVNPMLDTVGMTETVTGLLHRFGMAEEGQPLSPGATSLALAILTTELSEFWRLPLTIVLLPTISRRVLGRKFDPPAKPPTPGSGAAPGTEQER